MRVHPDRLTGPASEVCDEAYRSYGSLLYRLSYGFLLNQADAEDAVQEVFYRLMTRLPRFESEAHRRAWLLHVAANVCRDMLRRRKRRQTEALDDNLEAAPAAEENQVLRCILALPDSYRQVFLLHYLEGLDLAETGRLLKLRASAVKMRLSRGRTLLRAALEKEGIPYD